VSFKHLNVGAQIGLVFAVGLALFIAVATATLLALGGIRDAAERVNVATGAREAAADVLLQMVNRETAVRGYVATGNPHCLDILAASALHVEADMPVLNLNSKSQYSQEITAEHRVQSAVDKASAFFDQEIALVGAGKHTTALAHLNDERADFERLRDAVNQLAAYSEIHINDALEAQDDARLLLNQVIIGATAGAMLLFAWMAITLGRRIGRRLGHVSAAIDALAHEDVHNFVAALSVVADGDLTATFTFARPALAVDGHDEIARLSNSYNALVTAMSSLERGFAATTRGLRGALRGVLETSGELGGTSVSMVTETERSAQAIEHISHAFREVAVGASDQATRIMSASSSAEELSRTAGQIAQGAAEQAEAARSATDSVYRLDEQIAALASLGGRLAGATRDAIDQASSGSTAVLRTSEALTSLRAVNSDTVTAMTTLETRTSAVSEILGTIEEIADQTNLLALNAAIEAARAGEHGRGFAVVADEVRKLAERASRATREIGDILNAIRKEATTAMQALRSSTSRLEEGVAVANHGNDAITRIADAVRDTASVADEVADRSSTMRRESGAITEHIASVSSIVEENAAAATQMQQTTVDLSTQLTPVAVAAEEQSRTAEAVSSSAVQLSQQMQRMHGFASLVRDGSGNLRELVERFDVGHRELPAAPEHIALAAKSVG
jgi:methyl-accepting chemotaxis protein